MDQKLSNFKSVKTKIKQLKLWGSKLLKCYSKETKNVSKPNLYTDPEKVVIILNSLLREGHSYALSYRLLALSQPANKVTDWWNKVTWNYSTLQYVLEMI